MAMRRPMACSFAQEAPILPGAYDSRTSDALSVAMGHHQAGQLSAAAKLYQAILVRQPDHADALHLLGVVALQHGDPERARALIGRAIALCPDVAVFHRNLAEAHRLRGDLERALDCAWQAKQLRP